MTSKKLAAFTVTAVTLTATSVVLAINLRQVAEAEESLRFATAAQAEELVSQISVKSELAIEAECNGQTTTRVLELNPDEITGSLIVATMNDPSLAGCSFAGLSTQHLLIQGPQTEDISLTGNGFGRASAHVDVTDTGDSVEVTVLSSARAGLFHSNISAEAHATYSLVEDAQKISNNMMEAYTEAAPLVQNRNGNKTISQVTIPSTSGGRGP